MNTTPESDRPGTDGANAGGPGAGGPGTAGAGRPAGPPPTAGGSFFTWLRGLGIVRSSDRWFTGVAGGIAAKAGIDPLIVRGVFVVLTLLGGPGLLLYLAGWLLLPDATGRIHLEEIFRGRASTGVLITAIVIAALVVIPAVLDILIPAAAITPLFSVWGWGVWDVLGMPGWLSTTIAWLFWIAILVAAGLWLRSVMLQRGRERNRAEGSSGASAADEFGAAAAGEGSSATNASADPSPSAAAPGTAGFGAAKPGPAGFGTAGAAGAGAAGPGAAAAGASTDQRPFGERADEWAARTSQRAEEWGHQFGERAAKWGEDVGKQADDWSARYAEHHDAHRMGAAQTVLTLACALLAGGAAAVWVGFDAASGVANRIGTGVAPALIAGLTAALAVLAVSLIVAGVRGRHTGWVGFLSACGVVALIIAVVLPAGSRFQAFGNMQVDGRTESGAVLIAGNTEVDLSDLAERSDESDLVIWQLAGNSTVVLPDNAPVKLDVRVLAGRIDERRAATGSASAGPFLSRTFTEEARSGQREAATGDGVTTVTLLLLAGDVDVTGGGTGERSGARSGSTSGSSSTSLSSSGSGAGSWADDDSRGGSSTGGTDIRDEREAQR